MNNTVNKGSITCHSNQAWSNEKAARYWNNKILQLNSKKLEMVKFKYHTTRKSNMFDRLFKNFKNTETFKIENILSIHNGGIQKKDMDSFTKQSYYLVEVSIEQKNAFLSLNPTDENGNLIGSTFLFSGEVGKRPAIKIYCKDIIMMRFGTSHKGITV